MEIKTKYNIGDILFVLHQNKVCTIVISDITISIGRKYSQVSYISYTKDSNRYLGTFDESELFSTKEELLKSL